jgi:SulP family sulfate permease
MGEWHEFARMRHFPRTYQAVLMLTFLLTVTVDLTVAFEVGLVLAAFIIVTRLSQVTQLQPMSEVESFGHAKIGGEIEAYSLSGSLFFGSVHKLEDLLTVAGPQTKIIVLNVGGLINVDTSGLTTLRQVRQKLAEKGTKLLVAGAVGQPLAMMTKAGFAKELGGKGFFATTEAAFDHAAHMRGQHEEQPALVYA